MDTTHSINSPGLVAHESPHTPPSPCIGKNDTDRLSHFICYIVPVNVLIQHTYNTQYKTHSNTHTVWCVQLSSCSAVSLILPDLVDMTNLIIVAVQAMGSISILQIRHTIKYMHTCRVGLFHRRKLFLMLFLLLPICEVNILYYICLKRFLFLVWINQSWPAEV